MTDPTGDIFVTAPPVPVAATDSLTSPTVRLPTVAGPGAPPLESATTAPLAPVPSVAEPIAPPAPVPSAAGPTAPVPSAARPTAPAPSVAEPTAPLRSHRRAALPDNRWGRAGRRLGAAVLVVAALAVGRWVTAHTPDDDGMQKPFVRTAATGVPVDVRAFDVAVLSVRGAARIDEDGHPHDTSGVWILVKLRLTARGEPTTLEYAAVVDQAGRVYRATGRVDQPLVGGRTLQPGVPVTGEVAFEVPVAVATRLSVRLAPNALDQRMDAMAEVPLPVTPGEVAAWRADTRPATLAPAVAG